jgi:hypothetical protein
MGVHVTVHLELLNDILFFAILHSTWPGRIFVTSSGVLLTKLIMRSFIIFPKSQILIFVDVNVKLSLCLTN